jgi:hypothetical protein
MTAAPREGTGRVQVLAGLAQRVDDSGLGADRELGRASRSWCCGSQDARLLLDLRCRPPAYFFQVCHQWRLVAQLRTLDSLVSKGD